MFTPPLLHRLQSPKLEKLKRPLQDLSRYFHALIRDYQDLKEEFPDFFRDLAYDLR